MAYEQADPFLLQAPHMQQALDTSGQVSVQHRGQRRRLQMVQRQQQLDKQQLHPLQHGGVPYDLHCVPANHVQQERQN